MIVIKVYDNYWSNVVLFQTYLKQSVEIKYDLSSFWVATFTLENYIVHRNNKIEIYEAWSPDVLVFKWYVSNVEKTATVLSEKCVVTCWDGKGLLQERWPLYGYEEVSTPMPIVVSHMMMLWNAMGDEWEYQVDYNDPIDITYDLGSTCYNILDELANQVWGYWTVKDKKIIISPIIWDDKTSWSNSIEFFFDWTSASNVKQIVETQSEARHNVAIGIGNDWGKLMVYTQEGYPYWVVIENFQTGDLEEKTNALLDRENVDKRTLSVELDPNKDFNVNVGDKVNLRIENCKTIEDYNGTVLVINKEVSYKFWKKYVSISLGNSATTTASLAGLIRDINSKVDKIRNK